MNITLIIVKYYARPVLILIIFIRDWFFVISKRIIIPANVTNKTYLGSTILVNSIHAFAKATAGKSHCQILIKSDLRHDMYNTLGNLDRYIRWNLVS